MKISTVASCGNNHMNLLFGLLKQSESTILPKGAQGRLPAERSLHPEFQLRRPVRVGRGRHFNSRVGQGRDWPEERRLPC
jgi:hypothetical protein